MNMETVTVKHVSSGHIYTAQLYTSFVYLIGGMRVISIEDFNDFFEVVPTINAANLNHATNGTLTGQ